MSRQKGKREAGGDGWNRGGDPFAAPDGGRTGKKRTNRALRAFLIVLGCAASLTLVAVGLWKVLVVAPDVSDNDRPGVPSGEVSGATAGGEEPDTTSGRKEDYFTFLLLGKDTSSGSTDTIILVSYDVAGGAVNCMSIPRDTMVNVSWDIKRVNSVYSSKQGMDGLKTQISNLTGVMPDFYVMIEWEAVGRLVEALGGVYFDVPYNMNYDDPYQDLHIHQEAGYRLLSGDDAMQVIRWRKNNDGTNYGDTARVQIQQDFLKAVAKQCLQLGNWTKVKEFATIFSENVETDIPLQNLLWFAQKAMGVNMDNVQFMTMPGNYEGWAYSRTYGNNQSYVFAYPDEIVAMVNQFFNPYSRDITEDDLQIMGKNKDGSLYVTNGTLADQRAASAVSSHSGSSGSSSSSTPPAEAEEPELPPAGEGEGAGGESGTEPDSGSEPDSGTEPGPVPEPGPEPEPGTEPGAGGTDIPETPGEPTLPPEEPPVPSDGDSGSGGDTGESDGSDTQPPDWLRAG